MPRGRDLVVHPYSEDDLALFAAWRPHRQTFQPSGCTGGSRCWVDRGPPGCESNGGSKSPRCVECGGTIPITKAGQQGLPAQELRVPARYRSAASVRQ
jgi:hypothetical protein